MCKNAKIWYISALYLTNEYYITCYKSKLKIVIFTVIMLKVKIFFYFFFNAPAPTEIYPLSLPDPLPIYPPCPRRPRIGHRLHVQGRAGGPRCHQERRRRRGPLPGLVRRTCPMSRIGNKPIELPKGVRSEEHTSELQSQSKPVCRLLLSKK